jgi:hypothetical protein
MQDCIRLTKKVLNLECGTPMHSVNYTFYRLSRLSGKLFIGVPYTVVGDSFSWDDDFRQKVMSPSWRSADEDESIYVGLGISAIYQWWCPTWNGAC